MNILILDDSFTVRMIIESFLEDLGVHEDEIHSFENGFDALKYIEDNGVDLVFSDIHMPKMSGYEFASALFLEKKELKKVFFAISGDESRASFNKMKSLGVHRFLKKPIDSKHFNHFIQREVNRFRALENNLTKIKKD